jgi:hypothetical protein
LNTHEDITRVRLAAPGLGLRLGHGACLRCGLALRGHAYDYVLFSGLGHDNMATTFTVATDWIRRKVGRH